MILVILALGAFLLNLRAPSPVQEGSAVVRTYETAPLMQLLGEREPFEHLQWPQWTSAEGSWYERNEEREARKIDPTDGRAFGSRELNGTMRWSWERRLEDLFLLAGIDSSEPWKVEWFEGPPSRIALTAPEETHRFLRTFFDRLVKRLEHTVEFEVFLIDESSQPRVVPPESKTVFTAEEFKTRLQNPRTRLSHRTNARIGRVARLGTIERRELLWGYSTEAYIDGVSPQAEHSVARSGLDLYIDVQAAVLGGYTLRVRGQRSSLSTREEFYNFPGGAERTVELPTFHVQREGATATVEDGGGILLGSNTHSSSTWLIRVRSIRRPEDLPSFLPTGGMTANGNTLRGFRFLGPSFTGGLLFADDELRGAMARSTRRAPFQAEGLQEVLSLIEGENFAPFWIESEIYVGEDVARQKRVRQFLEAEAARAEANLAFELRFAEVERSVGVTLLRKTPSEIAFELPQRMFGCCRMGSSATSVQAVSTAYTSDVNVEISGASHPGHPIRSALDEGTSLELHAAPTRRGSIALEVELNHQVALQMTRKRRVGIPGISHEENSPSTEITLPATTGARFLAPLEVERGEWNLVGARDLVGTDRMVIAVIRIAR